MKRLGLALVLVLVVTACGDDDAGGVFDDASSSTTTPEENTTPSVSSTAPATTTLPEAESITTTESTTTTTLAIAAPSSTTTSTSGLAAPGAGFEFRPDGLGIVDFGDSPDVVVDALTAIFGAPLRDTGWVDEPICPGPMNRFVDFGVELFDFQVIFTTGNLFAPEGTQHFYSYRYNGATSTPASPPDLTVGTTVGQLMALYPTVYYDNNPFLDGVIDYHVDGAGNEQLYGQVSGTDPDSSVVESVQGGIGCGE